MHRRSVHIGRWNINAAIHPRRGVVPSSRFLRDERWYPCCRDIRTIRIKKAAQ